MRRFIYRVLRILFGYHSQNLAGEAREYARKAGKPYHGNWFNWRCWFYFGNRDKCPNKTLAIEVSSGWGFRWGFSADGSEREYMITFWIPFIQFYVTFGGFLWDFCYPKCHKEICVKLHDKGMWVSIWKNPFSWSASDKNRWYRDFCIHPLDIIFGRIIYLSDDIETVQVPFAMPEAHYTLTIKRFRSTWMRPRLPWFKHELLRAEIKPSKPVPVPGKGENSYDCGDDAIHSLTCPATTVGEAVGSFFESIDRQRTRYGAGLCEYADRGTKC